MDYSSFTLLNNEKTMGDIIYKKSDNSNLNSIFSDIEQLLKKNDKIEETKLLSIVEDLKKFISEHNKNIDEKYDEKYYIDKQIYLDNIKKWDIIQKDFNNDSIIFFY
jgi:hypothetical protein